MKEMSLQASHYRSEFKNDRDLPFLKILVVCSMESPLMYH